MKKKLVLIKLLILLASLCGLAHSQNLHSSNYGNTVDLLKKLQTAGPDEEDKILKTLFEIGDTRTDELVRALNDPNVSDVAQQVIRYLGNPRGMAGLESWYKTQTSAIFTGPVPFPLIKQDMDIIERALSTSSLYKWGSMDKYIYALAFDRSDRGKALLQKILDQNKTPEEDTGAGRAITQVRAFHSKLLSGDGSDPAKLVLENAFFVSQDDKKHTTASLIGFNSSKEKVLISVYINRGILAEEWYHVVLKRTAKTWEFQSVSQIAVS